MYLTMYKLYSGAISKHNTVRFLYENAAFAECYKNTSPESHTQKFFCCSITLYRQAFLLYQWQWTESQIKHITHIKHILDWFFSTHNYQLFVITLPSQKNSNTLMFSSTNFSFDYGMHCNAVSTTLCSFRPFIFWKSCINFWLRSCIDDGRSLLQNILKTFNAVMVSSHGQFTWESDFSGYQSLFFQLSGK